LSNRRLPAMSMFTGGRQLMPLPKPPAGRVSYLILIPASRRDPTKTEACALQHGVDDHERDGFGKKSERRANMDWP